MTILAMFKDLAPDQRTAREFEARLKAAIQAGDVASGTRLPPVRQAAWEWGCAPGTVSRVYNALQAQNLVYAQVGRGTFVGALDAPPSYMGRELAPQGEIDLSRNAVQKPSPYPLLEAASLAMHEAMMRRDFPITCIGEMGWAAHREAALGYVRRWRDVSTIDELVLTNGAQSGIAAALMALVPPGGAIAVDRQVYSGVTMAARLTGRRVVAVDMDEAGMCPDHLEMLCQKQGVRAVFVMPSLQNPTGRPMPRERREALIVLGARHDLSFIEDEVYGFLIEHDAYSFSRLAPERTLLVTGLSKSIAPVLRLGFVAGPPVWIRRVAAAHNGLQLMISPILSGMAAHILNNPAFKTRLETLQTPLKARAAFARQQLWPERVNDRTLFAGGIAWVPLPEGWTDSDFAREAQAIGVRVAPSRDFEVDQVHGAAHIRLSLLAVEEDTVFEDAILRLKSLMANPYLGVVRAP
ncbi:aminotransferase-like domain-containing protein [Woodsholea maritima]|uniref:aminotransferase-like domain-containing protein n=1 Tax=Woodsholea maritima TaxID=240237 RepID=UPI000477CCEA|nr:PLP-dependent aminotransferase family protein [Woodsholea maritima]